MFKVNNKDSRNDIVVSVVNFQQVNSHWDIGFTRFLYKIYDVEELKIYQHLAGKKY